MDLTRRARLVSRFGLLGFLFGAVYAIFYVLVGHHVGAGIIVVCSTGFALAPFLMRRLGSVALGGNLLSGIMVAGFTGLACVEGGMDGHAVAWLASVPLCALLLVGRAAATVWTIVGLVACAGLIGLHLAGVELPYAYDATWHPLITAAGYIGLIAFMFLLGAIFETSRARAFQRMQDALEMLETSNQQLRHLNKEKTEFLGIAAHDLKNPLTTIIGNAELLRMVKDPEKLGQLSDRIVTAGTRMRDLIITLLDANAIEEGRFTSDIKPCDFSSLIEQSIESNSANAARKEIEIVSELAANLTALTDANATIQILDNMISNAVKYSPLSKRVYVRSYQEDEFVVAAIKDEGPGISEEDQAKLFKKFSRLSAKPTGGESSTGLGLSIVKRLAESMNGTVGCRSRLGDGAEFYVKLPAGK